MSKSRRTFSNLDRSECVHELRELLPPGSTAFTILRNVSGSGMSRSIDVMAPRPTRYNGGPSDPLLWVSPKVGVVIDGPWDDRRECLRVGGAGMDMGFHVVYSLSGALWGHGQDLKRMRPDVPLTDRERRRLAAWRRTERGRYSGANVSGGYAITHRWI